MNNECFHFLQLPVSRKISRFLLILSKYSALFKSNVLIPGEFGSRSNTFIYLNLKWLHMSFQEAF
jgi:hypothetical protein